MCVLIVAAFVLSGWWWIVFQVPTPRGPAVSLMAGTVDLMANRSVSVSESFTPHGYGLGFWNAWGARRGRLPNQAGFFYVVEFPLWLPFLAVALPTLLAWRFWRKPPKPGHCRCGYDLTGNTSGVCPECGRTTGTRLPDEGIATRMREIASRRGESPTEER